MILEELNSYFHRNSSSLLSLSRATEESKEFLHSGVFLNSCYIYAISIKSWWPLAICMSDDACTDISSFLLLLWSVSMPSDPFCGHAHLSKGWQPLYPCMLLNRCREGVLPSFKGRKMGSTFNLSALEYLLRYRSKKTQSVVVLCISLGIVQISVREIFVNRWRQFVLSLSESYL